MGQGLLTGTGNLPVGMLLIKKDSPDSHSKQVLAASSSSARDVCPFHTHVRMGIGYILPVMWLQSSHSCEFMHTVAMPCTQDNIHSTPHLLLVFCNVSWALASGGGDGPIDMGLGLSTQVSLSTLASYVSLVTTALLEESLLWSKPRTAGIYRYAHNV